MSERITRLAPSPTGALHLGNARTFVINYLLARRRNWRVLMRVEDLDGPRIKADATERMLADLAWLGLTWDEPIVYQSCRADAYSRALDKLIRAGWAYPCICSRKDVELAAGAPHAGDGQTAYLGTCRGRFADADQALGEAGRTPAWRVKTDGEAIEIADRFAGTHVFNLGRLCGDFVIFRKDAAPAYQLAVVLDDAEAGVDAIVRGDDLLDSAARQKHLRRLLGIESEPAYWHLPLVVGSDGRRLAKRHGDTRLGRYRDRGVRPQRILGLIGYWSGALPERRPARMDELIERFEIDLVGKDPAIFTRADDEFLLGG